MAFKPAVKKPEKLALKLVRLEGPETKLDTKLETKYFGQAMDLMERTFPANEIESRRQYIEYFSDENSDRWYFKVFVDQKSDKVVGVSLYSYCDGINAVMYNLIVVDGKYRRTGISVMMTQDMLETGHAAALAHGNEKGLAYVFGEVEHPSKPAKDEMRDVVRPIFHDTVTKLRAMVTPEGKVVKYGLPIMASEKERASAAERGEEFVEDKLLFTLRDVKGERGNIEAQDAAATVYWFYKDYLGKECADVDQGDITRLLAETLTIIAGSPIFAQEIREAGFNVLNIVPMERKLRLVPIGETSGLP